MTTSEPGRASRPTTNVESGKIRIALDATFAAQEAVIDALKDRVQALEAELVEQRDRYEKQVLGSTLERDALVAQRDQLAEALKYARAFAARYIDSPGLTAVATIDAALNAVRGSVEDTTMTVGNGETEAQRAEAAHHAVTGEWHPRRVNDG